MSSEKQTLQLLDGEVVNVGEIISSSGYYELYQLPQNEASREASAIVLTKVDEVGKAIGIDIVNNKGGYKVVVYNPKTHNYICMDVLEIRSGYHDPNNLVRTVKIYRFNGESIDCTNSYAPTETKDSYTLISPDSFFVTGEDFAIQSFRDRYRIYSRTEEGVKNAPDIVAATIRITEEIAGTIIDPFEVIYGSLSDSQLIKIFLGKDTFVDQESKKVLTFLNTENKGTYPANVMQVKEHDYNETLVQAKEKLRKDLWDVSFHDLARRLNQEKDKKIST